MTAPDVQASTDATVDLHGVLLSLKQNIRNEMDIERNSAMVIGNSIRVKLVRNTYVVREKIARMFSPHSVIFDNPNLPLESASSAVIPALPTTTGTAEMSTVDTAEMKVIN